MAHTLVTQVDEHAPPPSIPPMASAPYAHSSHSHSHSLSRSSDGNGGGGSTSISMHRLDGDEDSEADEADDAQRGRMPQGCWRTFWQFLCSAGGKGGAEQSNSQHSAPQPAPHTSTPSLSRISPPRSLQPTRSLLPPPPDPSFEATKRKKCLVLDLDETLVHSSFKPIPDPDFVLTIDLDGVHHSVYVRKRPYVDYFLRCAAQRFELVIFTASLSKYADPLLDILDPERLIVARLFRESCVQHFGNYVKDLTHLGRPLQHTCIVDNSPFSYLFQPTHAIACSSWFNDRADRQLLEMLPFLVQLSECDDVAALIERAKLESRWSFFGAGHPNQGCCESELAQAAQHLGVDLALMHESHDCSAHGGPPQRPGQGGALPEATTQHADAEVERDSSLQAQVDDAELDADVEQADQSDEDEPMDERDADTMPDADGDARAKSTHTHGRGAASEMIQVALEA